ncbi:MAG TPA: ABC transporter permease [Candidatus Polarisedimenticolaceae bacterium]|nr:ABC transporter permease [Candidatus Polarisedimenticolaceae bacterium]
MPERRRERALLAGVALLGALLLLSLLGPWWSADPARISLQSALRPPSPGHLLGTDALGRDLAARLLAGGRISLLVGVLSTLVALAIGFPLGSWAGYRGGLADAAVSRAIETVLAVPRLVLALALLAVAPAWLEALPSPARVALVLGLVGWTRVARYLRAEFARLRDSTVVASARAAGAGHWRIMARHLLPASLAPVLVTMAFSIANAITGEAALSFLGLGVEPPGASWGALLGDARSHVGEAWWLAFFPGLALFLTVLACNWMGEGLRRRLDPRTGG